APDARADEGLRAHQHRVRAELCRAHAEPRRGDPALSRHLHRHGQGREARDDEGAVVERLCAARRQVVERAVPGNADQMIGRRSLAGAAVLAFAGPVLADTTARAQNQPDAVKLREELMALERQSWDYMKTRDRDALRRFLADDLLQVYADGSRYYKNDFLDYVA